MYFDSDRRFEFRRIRVSQNSRYPSLRYRDSTVIVLNNSTNESSGLDGLFLIICLVRKKISFPQQQMIDQHNTKQMPTPKYIPGQNETNTAMFSFGII